MEKQKRKKRNLEVALPSAMTIALGKENFKKIIKNTLCRVPVLWHSAKRFKKIDFFAECRSCGTRQRVFFKKK